MTATDPDSSASLQVGHPETWGAEQSKTVTWHDPRATAMVGLQLSGLEYLTAIGEGNLPTAPIANLHGIRGMEVTEGEIFFEMTPDESAYNPLGFVHGGAICTLLDTATGCAVHSTLPAGVGYTSIEIKVNYMRGVHAGVPLKARGWVTKRGRRVSFAEAEITDPEGKIVATASSSLLIIGGS
ncbi:MAG: PaaI family thioesterase [Solirubrobacteraceae bacterium]|nr:PaaI family thioesterase [Solirubrobacteraceae bacterium]